VARKAETASAPTLTRAAGQPAFEPPSPPDR
jgi:hypothetical protein